MPIRTTPTNEQTQGFLVGSTRLIPLLADITTLQADALVQPAGTSPAGESMVFQASPWVISADPDNTIARALSPHVPLQLGAVIITPPGALHARYLLHAVVIDWAGQHPTHQLIIDDVVSAAARKCIEVATALNLKSIAFTPWGTQAAGEAADRVTAIMMHAIVTQLQEQPSTLETVYLVSNVHAHYQWFVDRAFVFHLLFEQMARVKDEIRGLDIPQERRQHLLSLLDNLQQNVVVYNEIVSGDKIDARGGYYQPNWQPDTVNQAAGDIHNAPRTE